MLVALLTVGSVGLTACSGGDGTTPTEPTASVTPTPAADPPAAPEVGDCYQLTFDEAIAPTSSSSARRCGRKHTSQTYRVGELTTVVDGHLLAVDSDRVQDEVADACPAALSAFVGGDTRALRLSMIRPVWFAPTVEESDAGADWFRCDAVVVNGSSTLVTSTESLKGVLDSDAGRVRVGMCGTAAPDDEDFSRVPCSEEHSWRAIEVVTFPAGDYPGSDAAQDRGQAPCEDAASDLADDPLDFEWGYEWPTKEQWTAGQTFGRCWVPDSA